MLFNCDEIKGMLTKKKKGSKRGSEIEFTTCAVLNNFGKKKLIREVHCIDMI